MPSTSSMTTLHRLRRRATSWFRRGDDTGASAIELAVIAGVLVIVATLIGAAVYNIVEGESQDLQECVDQPANTACAPGGGGGGG